MVVITRSKAFFNMSSPFWLWMTLKPVSRHNTHNGVHFLYISAFQRLWHFDFEMCFARWRRPLFESCSGAEVFYEFWNRNLIPVTFFFRLFQFPKMLWGWGVLYTLTSDALRGATARTFSASQLSKSAPRHSLFNTFWLRNVLRATTACIFSGHQCWAWNCLRGLTSTSASRHSGSPL